MAQLNLSEAELRWLVDVVSAQHYWPPVGSPAAAQMYMTIPAEHRGGEGAGGPALRIRLIAALRQFEQVNAEYPGRLHALPFDLDLQEAWLIDGLLWNIADLYTAKFRDSQLAITLARRVWDVLIAGHASQLPSKEAPNATGDNDPRIPADRSALEDADAIIAALEARARASAADGPGQGA